MTSCARAECGRVIGAPANLFDTYLGGKAGTVYCTPNCKDIDRRTLGTLTALLAGTTLSTSDRTAYTNRVSAITTSLASIVANTTNSNPSTSAYTASPEYW